MPRGVAAAAGALLDGRYSQVHEHSAGYDTSGVGRDGLRGLVELSTAANFLALSRAQAAKLRQTALVTNLRAAEAANVLKYLEDHGGERAHAGPGEPKRIVAQFASGPGFGVGDVDDDDDDGGGGAGGLDLGDLRGAFGGGPRKGRGGARQKAGRSAKGRRSGGAFRGKKGGGAAGIGALAGTLANLAGAAQGKSELDGVDLWAADITRTLHEVLARSHRVKYDAATLQQHIDRSSALSNKALYLAAKELNYPGYPPEMLQRLMPRGPVPARRPADLAPAWLDFVYTSPSAGTDPYRGLEENNVFGSPPVPAFDARMEPLRA